MEEPKVKGRCCGPAWTYKLGVNLMLMTAVWVAASFNYYLISFYMKYVPGDIFVNNSVSCVAELAADLLSCLFVSRLGIKKSFVGSFILAAVGGICI